jgi:hypothetical protein
MISSEFIEFMKRIIVEESIPHMGYAMIVGGAVRLYGSEVTINGPDMQFTNKQHQEYQLHNVEGTTITFSGSGYWFVVAYEDKIWKITRRKT